MATDLSFVEYVREQAGLEHRLTHRKMFGEYALYLEGRVVAFVCDNQVFIKPTEAGGKLAPQAVVVTTLVTGLMVAVPAAGDVARVPKFMSVFLRSDSGFRTIAPAFDSFDGVAACTGTGAAASNAGIAVVS